MRLAKILTFICMLFIGTSLVVQAAEVDAENAVVSVTSEDKTRVFYYDSIEEAISKAAEYEGSTVQLLSSISLKQTLLITDGNFTIDLHGERLSYDEEGDTAVSVLGGTVRFIDSSSEKKGAIVGDATAVAVNGSAKVCIESGNYQAETWTVTTSVYGSSTSNPTLEIKGGNICGSVAVFHNLGELSISGGEFRSDGQAALSVSDKACVDGGTFYGQIEVFSSGTLDFRDGRLFVHDYIVTSPTPLVYGITNWGTLNLSGGTIMAAEDEDNPVYGVKNAKGEGTATALHLSGDVTFDQLDADFYLEKPMTVDYTLQKCYRVAWLDTYETEPTAFATAGDGIVLSKESFVSEKKGYLVVLSEDQSSLSLRKCEHPEVDNQHVCKACGIVMQARIGNQYYEFLKDAINAVTENQTLVLLADTENLSIGSGTFSLDLNGYAIRNSLAIVGGKIILKGKGTVSSGEYIKNLSVNPDAFVEIQGVTVKGTDYAILNLGGTLVLKGGEITAEKIAIVNLGGTVAIGEAGAGPVIKASTGIINSKLVMEDTNWDAVLCIYGGSVTAKTDIYNQTGEYPYEAELISGASLTAGTVNLKGGTFVDGLHVMLDEGLNLTNILDEGRGYYGIDGQAIPVGSGTVQLNQTVMVEIPAKLGDISTSGNSKTTYGQSCTIGVTIEKDTTVYNYTYQWYDASGKIKGATSAEYTVPSNQAAGDYNYFCRVTATRKDNGLSETKDSGAIRVTVSKAEQPTHQHAYKEHVTKATTKAAGKIVVQCECGKIKSTTVIKKIKTVKLSEGTFTFNGKKKSPSVIVKDSSGKKLAKGKDYKVALPNGRINAGIYTYKITFTGNYKGTKSIKLTIRPKAVTLNTVKAAKKAVTVKWKKASKTQTTGYQVMVATNKNFTKNKKLITIKGYKNTSKKVTKLKAKTKYYVKVRSYKTVKINGKNTKVYSNWTKIRMVTVK